MINKVILIGNLGNPPVLNQIESGKSVASFSIATSETYKNRNGEKVQDTQWHNIVAWGSLAEICDKYLTKGSKVFIEGKLTTRSYEDKEGVKKYITEVVAREMKMLSPKNSELVEAVKQSNNNSEIDDDLPF